MAYHFLIQVETVVLVVVTVKILHYNLYNLVYQEHMAMDLQDTLVHNLQDFLDMVEEELLNTGNGILTH